MAIDEKKIEVDFDPYIQDLKNDIDEEKSAI
jgi:hypothetical protein